MKTMKTGKAGSQDGCKKVISILCSAVALSAFTSILPVKAGESTMPPPYVEKMNPEVAAKYIYTEGGDFAGASSLPTYQWMPADGKLRAIILGIHGLTLHGRRYRVLARTMAINGVGFVAPDMRGFGACHFNDDGSEKQKGELTGIAHELSYQDISKILQAIRAKYPDLPIMVLGESLGCTFCIRLASEHPDLVTGVILSAPAVRVNPKMYASPQDIKAGLKALVTSHHLVNLNNFFTDLVSERPEVSNEMKDDPFILKGIKIKDLIATDLFVDKTIEWCKNTSPRLPMLVIQGSNDKCVLPKHLTDMMMNMRSNDMRIAWKGSFGHLQLETIFMRANIIDSIGMWLHDHSIDGRMKLKKLEEAIADLGGTLVR